MDAYDLVIIGGGAAGSEAAFSVGGRTHRVLIAESHHFGGTCTNHGCVPTKALVKAAKVAADIREAAGFGIDAGSPRVDWPAVIGRARRVRDHMLRFGTAPFEEQGITVRFPATAIVTGERQVEIDGERVEARSLLVAAGLVPAVPPIPGLADAGHLDNESILELDRLPASLGVIGSGPIGFEFAQIFSRLGVRVTVLEVAERVLPPEEPETGEVMARAFAAEGIACRTGVRIERVERAGAGRRIHLAGGDTVEVDQVLVAAGRTFDGAGIGLDRAGIDFTAKGVTVDEHMRTSQPWAWAAGDVVGGALFTHVASEMGQVAGRNALRGEGPFESIDLRIVPRVTFTDPEVASVGMTEEQARQSGRAFRVGRARLEDAEKAQIDGEVVGHVKVVVDGSSGELLGCAIVAPAAGEMIHEAAAAMAGGTPVSVLARTMHAYPTYSELMRSAFADSAG